MDSAGTEAVAGGVRRRNESVEESRANWLTAEKGGADREYGRGRKKWGAAGTRK